MVHFLFQRTTFFVVIVLGIVQLQSCQPDDLQLSSIDTSSIQLKGISLVNTTVEGQEITLTVPYGTNLGALQPTFRLTDGGEVVPKLGGTFDFSKPVYFTVVHPSGGKQIYTFIVSTEEQPAPIITSFSAQEIEAGQSFELKGHYFGNYGLGIKVALVNTNQLTAALRHQLKDSTTLVVTVPDSLASGAYQVALQVKDKSTVSSQKIKITYPTPIISQFLEKYALDGDTVRLLGKYLDLKQNQFTVSFLDKSNVIETKSLSTQATSQELKIIIPTGTLPSTYTTRINNKTIQKNSKELAEAIVVYSSKRPYVQGIVGNQQQAKVGEEIYFDTKNFEKEPIRFYQVQLTNGSSQYTLNGVYDTKNKQLQVSLPPTIQKGTYAIGFLLSNPSENYYYRFHINTKLELN